MRLTFIWVTLLLFLPAKAISWWQAGRQVTEPERFCQKARTLRGRLGKICSEEKELFENIKWGISLGLENCQSQFKNRRWNCSTEKKSLKKILLRDTPETAFVNALAAAGVTYQVATACDAGKLIQCNCDRDGERKPSPQVDAAVWKWGGCSNSVAFGLKNSKAFLDYPYRKRSDLKLLVRLHNNQAGRLAIRNYMTTVCKCHGVSGSCSLKICWRRMPKMDEVAGRLRDQFDRAILVIPTNDGRHFIPDGKGRKPPGREKLVYAQDSPDFCRYNRKNGSLGTQGRFCNVTSTGMDGCNYLCCYRGYSTQIHNEQVDCRCNFTYCCTVKCETCITTKEVNVCN